MTSEPRRHHLLPQFYLRRFADGGEQMAVVSRDLTKRFGGWKSEAMLRRYAALTDETLKLAAEAVAAHGQGRPLRLVQRSGS